MGQLSDPRQVGALSKVEITPAMVEAGARELLLYDDDSDRREVTRLILIAAFSQLPKSFHRC